MSTLRLNVDTTDLTDSEVDDLLKSAAKNAGWKEKIEDENGDLIDNPESAMDFYAKRLGDVIRNDAKSYKAVQAAEKAREDAKAAVDATADKASVTAEKV